VGHQQQVQGQKLSPAPEDKNSQGSVNPPSPNKFRIKLVWPKFLGLVLIVTVFLSLVLLLLRWRSMTPSLDETRPTPSPSPTADKRTAELIISPLTPLRTESGVNEVALNMDAELLASAEGTGKVKLWHLKSGRPPEILAGSGKATPARCVVISPNGESVAAGDATGNVRIWPKRESTPTLIASHTGTIYELYFSEDGQSLVSTGADSGNIRSARLWKVSGKPELLKTFKLPDLKDQVLTISPDLVNTALYSPQHKRIEIWSMSENKLKTSLENSDLVIRAGGAFSSDGQLIAVGSDDGTVRIWQVGDGRLLTDLIGEREATISVAFHPSGRMVAAGYLDGSVRLWSISDPNNPKVFKEQSQPVFSVTFSGNGRLLASGMEDGKILLWEVREEFK
jgi:WD40 repeat protein